LLLLCERRRRCDKWAFSGRKIRRAGLFAIAAAWEVKTDAGILVNLQQRADEKHKCWISTNLMKLKLKRGRKLRFPKQVCAAK